MKTVVPNQRDPGNNDPQAYMRSAPGVCPTPHNSLRRAVEDWGEDSFGKRYLLLFQLKPKVEGKSNPVNKVRWEATLLVQVTDLPRLMREGFYWSLDNVRSEEGYFAPNDIRHNGFVPSLEEGWDITRVYFLEDLAEEPLWTGWLIVFAKSNDDGLSTLSQFRVSDLLPEMVCQARAINRERHEVYFYSAFCPGQAFNAIYDDMPMEGWWPWPKGKEEQERQAAAAQLENRVAAGCGSSWLSMLRWIRTGNY